jgi:geranylgeranyl reductase family protein
MPEHDAEVIIVGAGPAGSSAATLLADAGHRVMLLDKATFPRHKPCSDYASPASARLLEQLGVLGDVIAASASRMEAMVVQAPNGSRFTAAFGQVDPGAGAIGLSRYRLDNILLERAKAAGATVLQRAHARNVIRTGERVTGVEVTIDGTPTTLHAPIVIGADGHDSVVSRSLGLDQGYPWLRKTGLAAHYRGVQDLERFGEMHVGHGAYAGLAILENGLTNLTVVVPSRALREKPGSLEDYFAATIASLPGIASKLDCAERVGPIRGVGPMARRVRRVTGDGYLLLGDAAGFLDPFVGEGVYQALRSGFLAAPVVSVALRSGDTSAEGLDAYRRARRREFLPKRAVSWVVQGFVNTPPLMDYVTDRLAARDDLGLTLAGVLGNLRPAGQALSPVYLAKLLRP